MGITNTSDFLQADLGSLMASTGLSLVDIQKLIDEVSENLCPITVQASDMYNNYENNQLYLPTGWTSLDEALQGGILIGSLTEIFGTIASGKTQLCLQICAQTIFQSFIEKINNGNDNGNGTGDDNCGDVIYYDLEQRVPAKRLGEMLDHLLINYTQNKNKNQQPNLYSLQVDKEKEQMMSHIIIKRPLKCQALLDDLLNIQAQVIEKKVKLIVIDNISSLIRKDNIYNTGNTSSSNSNSYSNSNSNSYSNSNSAGTSSINDGSMNATSANAVTGKGSEALERYILNVTSTLKNLADECQCAVLFTNAMYDTLNLEQQHQYQHSANAHTDNGGGNDNGNGNGDGDGDGTTVDLSGAVIGYKPILGVSWHHYMSTRLVLSCTNTSTSTSTTSNVLVIEKSHHVQNRIIPFQIATGGLED
jgi:RecA/RadA recombinase